MTGRRIALAVFASALISTPATGDEPKPKLDGFGDPLPSGAVARLGTERFRVRGALAFLPDGKTIAAKNLDSSLRLLDVDTGKVVGEIRSDDALFRSYAITPDGKRIVSVGVIREEAKYPTRGALRVWDAKTLKEIRTIRWPDNVSPTQVRLIGDGKIAATADRNGVRLWDLEGTDELPSHTVGEVEALAVTPDGSTIAVASRRNGVELWEWRTKNQPRRLSPEAPRDVMSVEFSPDGKTLAVGVDYTDGVLLYDVPTGKRLAKLAYSQTLGVRQVAFTRDSKHVITPNQRDVYEKDYAGGLLVWDARTGKLIRELPTPGQGAQSLALSPDGTRLAATIAAGIRIWDTSTWQEITRDDGVHRAMISALAVTGEGKVVTGSFDRTVCLWDLKDGRPLRKTTGAGELRAMAFSPDGRLAARTQADEEIVVWNVADGKTLFKLPGHGSMGPTRLAITADGKRLLSFGRDLFLRITDLSNGKAVVEHAIRPAGAEIPEDENRGRYLDDFLFQFGPATFSPDGRRFIWNFGKNFFVFDVETGKEHLAIGNPGSHLASLVVSPDGSRLLSSAWARPRQVQLPNGQARIGVQDSLVSVWKIENGERVFTESIPEIDLRRALFSPDAKTVAIVVAGTKPRIVLMSADDGKSLKQIALPSPPAHAFAFTPDGKQIVCAMGDTTALVFDVGPLDRK